VGTSGDTRDNRAVASYERTRKALARKIRERRRALGLTQESLAERGEFDVRHVQKLEAAQLNVSLQTMCRLAAALKLSLSELFL
jgi:transcriptional regulator with XRE-family HTH domain